MLEAEAVYIVTHRRGRPSLCFPQEFDTSDLVEHSRLEGPWAEFLNIKTGAMVSCEDFYTRMLAAIPRPQNLIQLLPKSGEST